MLRRNHAEKKFRQMKDTEGKITGNLRQLRIGQLSPTLVKSFVLESGLLFKPVYFLLNLFVQHSKTASEETKPSYRPDAITKSQGTHGQLSVAMPSNQCSHQCAVLTLHNH